MLLCTYLDYHVPSDKSVGQVLLLKKRLVVSTIQRSNVERTAVQKHSQNAAREVQLMQRHKRDITGITGGPRKESRPGRTGLIHG